MLREPGDEPPEPRRPFQFTMSTMFLLVALMSVVFAGVGGMFRYAKTGGELRGHFVIITLLAPLGLVVLLGGLRLLWLRHQRRGTRRPRW
jgi:hypothetical protein